MGKNEKDRDMSKELIERLRADAESTDDIGLCADAADRIEELERKVASRDAEVAKLKDDNEYLYVAAIERDQLRAKINVLREALSSAESALDESRDYPVTYDEVITALITTPEQSLAAYRNKVIEECAERIDFAELVGVLGNVTAHLIAAHSLLSSGGKKAVASDTIFKIMLQDYEKSFEAGRKALAKVRKP